MHREARVVPLSRDSHVAMYRQIAGQLRDAIACGVFKPGEKIPAEPELLRRFGVSRITARQAVDALAREGLVIRKQGKGTFVAAPLVRHDLHDLRGIYDGLIDQGLNPQTRVLECAQAVPPPRIAAQMGSGTRKLLHWRRLYELRGKPFALASVHLDTGRARVGREQVARHPTYSILENLLGERVGRADVTIRYGQADAGQACLLGLKRGAPLMVFERVSFDAKGAPREHSLYYARAETYEFSLTVRGKLPISRAIKAQK